MTETYSNAPPRPRQVRKAKKPAKPHKDFPLFAHANGQWAKKVRQKMHFFGVWADPQRALESWLHQKDELLAGREPQTRHPDDTRHQEEDARPRVHNLVNTFLTRKLRSRDAGELSPYTFVAYEAICKEIVETFGRERLLIDFRPADFASLRERWVAKGWGVERLSAETNRARTVFRFAYSEEMIDRPFNFGEGFKRPSKKVMRLNKDAKGPKMFTADELRRMIDTATQPMKAMLLLAANGGFGNNDVALLPLSALDLSAGWLTYPRPKTGITRRIPLWKETVSALKEWLAMRPTPRNEASERLVFLTVRGDGWGSNVKDRPVTHECRKLLDKLGINGGRNFYGIRHGFETVAGESKDQVAVDFLMGHDDGSMGAKYRDGIGDDRLRAVVEHVHGWLWPEEKASPKKEGGAA